VKTIPTPDIVNPQRRRLFGAAAAIAAAQLGLIRTASAEGANKSTLPAIKPGKTTSFAPLKQINAGVLNVGYAEAGPAEGRRSCCCMAGRTTSTASPTWRRRWPQWDTE